MLMTYLLSTPCYLRPVIHCPGWPATLRLAPDSGTSGHTLQDPRVPFYRDPEVGEGCPRYTREECRERSPAPDLSPGSLRASPVPALAAILGQCGGADGKLGLRGLLSYVRPTTVGKRSETILLPVVHPGSFLEPGHRPRSRALA